MKVTVDRSLCENHGQCALIAPEVFQLDTAGQLDYHPEPGEEHREAVLEAADLCPVQAILADDA